MFDITKGPLFIHLDLTGACNLKCVHCRATSKSSPDELTTEEIIDLIDKCKLNFPNWENIFIGGGEPLLRKKDLFKILDYCQKKNIKCFLNTNALLINEEDIENLKKYIEIIQVSIDGASANVHDEIRGVKGAFDSAIKNIELLVKNNIRTYLRMTLSNYNYHEAFDLIDLGQRLGVEAVSYYRTLPVGNAKKYNVAIDKKLYYSILKELMKRSYKIDKPKIVSTDPLKMYVDTKMQAEVKEKYKEDISLGGCLPGITEIFINSIGNVYPCTMQPVFLGNIKEEDIGVIWKNSEHLNKLRDKSNLKGKCKSCEIRNFCGGCRAAAYGKYGDYFDQDPYCPKTFNDKEESEIRNKIEDDLKSPCQSC